MKERFHCAVIGQWKRTQVMDCFVWGDLGEWGEVPKDALYASKEWKALLASVGTFSYTVNGFKKADPRYSRDQVRAPMAAAQRSARDPYFGRGIYC